MPPARFVLALVAALAFVPAAHAGKKTICTITVNSSDEREAFRRNLPKGEYDFVELVEKGRDDWLAAACHRGVQCDALVISGHFNAGDTFYSDNVAKDEHLNVDELERASCSASCPGLFAKLKEVYLFGCESLNPDATKYQSSEGESGRERMRRLFANVPAIYGFSGAAPVGATAGALIGRYFASGGPPIATGRPNGQLLRQFSFNHMVMVQGVRDSDPGAGHRREVCEFYDTRSAAAKKLAFVHALMRRDSREVRGFFERIEKLWGSFSDADRGSPEFLHEAALLSADDAARERFLGLARSAPRPEIRARMIALARAFAWLTAGEERTEYVRLAADLMDAGAVGYAEVDLICSLNDDHSLDGTAARLARHARTTADAAVLACLGDREAHAQVVRALFTGGERDVEIAQAYLRNRPLTDRGELREVAAGIARMPSPVMQVRALGTLARLQIDDHEILRELEDVFAAAKTPGVQSAIAEVFIRSGSRGIAKPELASWLRRHRLPAGRGEDLVDVLLRSLQS
ncbi:MAG TPA: hypothetical protein VN598_07280 [Usitatibacter sp.]|nr:hypothetical protein [Usitatibacter sp.]